MTLAATLSSSYGMHNGFELLEHTPIPGEPDEIRIVRPEAHELWIRIYESREGPHESVELHERPIAIARDRQPAVRGGIAAACPSPLIWMTIPIADE